MSDAIGDNVMLNAYVSTPDVNLEIDQQGLLIDLYLTPERALALADELRVTAEKVQEMKGEE